MKQSNPIISLGVNRDNQRRGRARMRLAVVGIVLAHVVLFAGILFNACKQDGDEEKPETTQLPELPPLQPTPGSLGPSPGAPFGPVASVGPVAPPSAPPLGPSPSLNPVTPTGPIVTTPLPVVPVSPTTAVEHVIAAGDSFYKLARKYGVGYKAIKAVNPGVVPTKLQIGQKIVIPPPKVSTAVAPSGGGAAAPSLVANEIVIKRGDSLGVLARRYSTTVRALQQANSLNGTRILAGQKLKLPAGARLPIAPSPAAVPVVPPSTTLVPGTGGGADAVSPPPPVTVLPSGN